MTNYEGTESEDSIFGKQIKFTSNLSSLALWFCGSTRNSSVRRMHSPTFSGETKSRATFMHDWKKNNTMKFIVYRRKSSLRL